jgi:predicted TPR repeat methyltransferase
MDKQTLKAYNDHAIELAEKFEGMGSRKKDIDLAFKLFRKQNPSVLELGCGDGRDAYEICKLTDSYLGIDQSAELIKIARDKVTNGNFEVSDMIKFNPPQNYDIVFAFASLLHMSKPNLKKVITNTSKNLNSNGIIYISLKRDTYQKRVQKDEFGIRTFYYYEPSDIEATKLDSLSIVLTDYQTIGTTNWFTVALQKN